MKAVILAGGKGTRLAPYTTVLPKPLMPVGGMPILEIVIRQLVDKGFTDVVLAIGYLGSLIRAYFDNHPISEKINIIYHNEMHPLGTAGALATIDGLADAFLAMNGDILTTLDYADMYRYHKAQNASLTVAITRKSVQIELGVLELDQDHRIIGYDEKPVMTYQASMGVYIYEPRLKEMMVPGEYLDVPNLVLKMIEKGERIAAYSPDVFWLDMGNRTDYEKADEEVAKNPNAFIPSL